AAPATCGVAIEVPAKTENVEPVVAGGVDERTSSPGAATSGFRNQPKSVGPADEKLVITPERPVWISWMSLETRICAWPPFAARYARRVAPSRSEIIPAGTGRRRGMPFASPKRLSTRIRPIAPPSAARWPFEKNVHLPRRATRIFPFTASLGIVPTPAFGSAAEPHRYASTGLPSVPTTAPASTTVWSRDDHASGSFAPPADWIGTAPSDGGPPTTRRAGAKTCAFETAATVIASGVVPGEPAVPSPKSSRSLPAAITGTTPASATLCTVSYI